jgi:hypothetical protein
MDVNHPKEYEMSGFPKMNGMNTRALIYCKVTLKMLQSAA